MEKIYLPDDIMNMILKFRTEEMKKDKYKFNYDKVIKQIGDNHVLYLFGRFLLFPSHKCHPF